VREGVRNREYKRRKGVELFIKYEVRGGGVVGPSGWISLFPSTSWVGLFSPGFRAVEPRTCRTGGAL